MTEKQKTDAKLAFDKGNYALAFKMLWELGVHKFIAYAEKEINGKKPNWFAHPESGKFFWEEFILSEEVFDTIFNSNLADQILHNYFSKYKVQVKQFETVVASKLPQLFVKAIRTNQVFLKEDRIEHLTLIQFDSTFQLHQKVWKWISEIEQLQWKAIETELSAMAKISLNEILSHCIIWLEKSRFMDNKEQNLHYLANVYNFFIELVLSKYPEKSHNIVSKDDFFKQFFDTLFLTLQKEKKMAENAISILLTKIGNWINFREDIISPYSFDLNIELAQQNELIFFNSTPEAYYKWLVNGIRYGVNRIDYIFKGAEFIDYLEKNNFEKVPGKTEEDIQLNRNLASLKLATLLLLDDLICKAFKIGNTHIEPKKLLDPLITYSFNRSVRYEKQLSAHAEISLSWSESFINSFYTSAISGVKIEPFFLMTEEEYKELNKQGLRETPEDFTKEVVKLFSYQSTSEFNRFQQKYDVWLKPFFKIGNFLFCPITFFATNIWFYSFAQVALSQKSDRSETQEMENHLGEIIRKKGWKVEVISDKKAQELKGDVDIFVEDENTTLFIQLKRTYFRLDLKDAYYEGVNTDSKAAKQLSDAEEYLKQPNTIYEFKHIPIKWIVSTSFENIGSEINGCLKVNYFELLNALNNPEVKNLSDLAKDLESDKNLKLFISSMFDSDLPIAEQQMIADVAKPLAMFESTHYKQLICSEDQEKTENYNSIVDEAIRLDKSENKNEALILLQKCVILNPNDGDILNRIANILADMGLYEMSFIEFKSALELLPNDPCISRNYALALIESGRYFDGLLLLIQIYEKFPLFSDIRNRFEKHFEQCLKNGSLSNEQVIELHTKWEAKKL